MTKQNVQTLEDIAQLASVSRSTVSRALNNSPLISQQTKERIQAIAQQHNFRINCPARNLRLRQGQTIAFVAPVYSPEFFSADDLLRSKPDSLARREPDVQPALLGWPARAALPLWIWSELHNI